MRSAPNALAICMTLTIGIGVHPVFVCNTKSARRRSVCGGSQGARFPCSPLCRGTGVSPENSTLFTGFDITQLYVRFRVSYQCIWRKIDTTEIALPIQPHQLYRKSYLANMGVPSPALFPYYLTLPLFIPYQPPLPISTSPHHVSTYLDYPSSIHTHAATYPINPTQPYHVSL